MATVKTDTTSVQETERELWIEYMVATARYHENQRLADEAWHDYVLSGLDGGVHKEVWNLCQQLVDDSRKRRDEAERVWKRVAYPLHNIPLSEDEK